MQICIRVHGKDGATLFTEINNIVNFYSHVLRDGGKHLTICASGHRGYGCKVSTIMFDKFDALFLLFPKLEMTIYGGCNEKISPEGRIVNMGNYERLSKNPDLVIVQKLITSRCMKDL